MVYAYFKITAKDVINYIQKSFINQSEIPSRFHRYLKTPLKRRKK